MDAESAHPVLPTSSGPMPVDEEVTTFFQMEAEAQKLTQANHECPIPKPKGMIGELLGFRNAQGDQQR